MDALPYLKEVSLKRDRVESFDEYPFSLPVMKNLDSIEFGRELTIFVGEVVPAVQRRLLPARRVFLQCGIQHRQA